ncbi:HAMP domain-containing histidine kinase [Campylobacter sp. FMV-PI01]|uniref:HAMP domain-containing histidine kinase n=1 Tax=Campylobacter portucalensis TaxID=2608384 RepID=A0A6L5WJ31_9BACT|nr:ATP-binding protein [Campylobacter portucalensis]MSN95843.1 HAMP domain-containing histidine kinase [Campylobacter portucalensis]
MQSLIKNLTSKFFYKFEDIKIYTILIIFTLLVALFGALSYFEMKKEILKTGANFRASISKEITFSVNEWLETRVKSTQNIASFLEFFTDNYSEDKTLKFIKNAKIINKGNPFFDHYQVIFDNATIIFDEKIHKITKDEFDKLKQKQWYQNSVCKDKTIITTIDFHGILKEKTINICAPFGNAKLNGTVCGIIKTKDFFHKIRTQVHSFVDNAYLFNEDGDIISSINLIENPSELKNSFLMFKENLTNYIFMHDENYIEIIKIPNMNWYVGVGINEEVITSSTIKILLRNGIILTILFILLIIVSNSFHTFIHNKILKKQKEYEFILSYQLKMSETGELISAISHQLKQPLNSSLLLLSNTINLKKLDEISDEELLLNLDLCVKSNMLMNETIENFRNFYRFSDDIKKFNLYDCILSLVKLLHMEFSRYSVVLEIDKFDITLNSNESFLKQIILVLLQNSKDALKDKNGKKIVKISAKICDEFTEIFVSDTGSGVLKPKNLFTKYKQSSKKHGSGVGLYLSKLIANTKLSGDLELFKSKNPTIFKLKIKTDMDKR